MSLYNIMHGFNEELALLVSLILDMRIDLKIPRLRDVFTEADNCPYKDYDALIYTRMGGGNYQHWEGCPEDFKNGCPFCQLLEIEKLPWCIGGYDDDYDNTFRTLVVKYTPEQQALRERLREQTPLEVFGEEKLKSMFPNLFNKQEETDETD